MCLTRLSVRRNSFIRQPFYCKWIPFVFLVNKKQGEITFPSPHWKGLIEPTDETVYWFCMKENAKSRETAINVFFIAFVTSWEACSTAGGWTLWHENRECPLYRRQGTNPADHLVDACLRTNLENILKAQFVSLGYAYKLKIPK